MLSIHFCCAVRARYTVQSLGNAFSVQSDWFFFLHSPHPVSSLSAVISTRSHSAICLDKGAVLVALKCLATPSTSSSWNLPASLSRLVPRHLPPHFSLPAIRCIPRLLLPHSCLPADCCILPSPHLPRDWSAAIYSTSTARLTPSFSSSYSLILSTQTGTLPSSAVPSLGFIHAYNSPIKCECNFIFILVFTYH